MRTRWERERDRKTDRDRDSQTEIHFERQINREEKTREMEIKVHGVEICHIIFLFRGGVKYSSLSMTVNCVFLVACT